MWTIVCLLFFLVLIFVLRYVGSGYTNVIFRLSLYLLCLKLSLYLVRILYFVVVWLITRLHQSKQAYSTTCKALLLCKYQIPSNIPCCNLQNINMFSLWSCLFSTILCEMWENLRHDCQKFHQYQQQRKSSTSDHNKDQDILCWKFRYCLGTGTNILLLILVAFLTIIVYTFLSQYLHFLLFKNTLYRTSECQHKIEEHCLILTYYL